MNIRVGLADDNPKLLQSITKGLKQYEQIQLEFIAINGQEVLDNLDKKPNIGIITGWSEKLDLLKKENMKVDLIAKKPFNFSELTRQINGLRI